MMNGEVDVGSWSLLLLLKKLGQTLPPNVSSNLAMVVFGIPSLDRRKRNAPFHAGHTGNLAYF